MHLYASCPVYFQRYQYLYCGMGYPWAAHGSSTNSPRVALTKASVSVILGGTEDLGSFTINLFKKVNLLETNLWLLQSLLLSCNTN